MFGAQETRPCSEKHQETLFWELGMQLLQHWEQFPVMAGR